MARTRQEIKKEITTTFLENKTIQEFYGISEGAIFEDEFSLVSLENVLFDVFVFCIFILEQIFDRHKKDVDNALLELKPHTARWYRNKALAFQYGFDLKPDSDVFNNEKSTDEQVENSKIIKYAAVTETTAESRLVVKIATEEADKLQPISQEQKTAFEAYINEIKDAGVKITVTNYLPDRLFLNLKIYYNPLVLDSSGRSILTGKKPVEDAINEYMKNLPFDGELVLAHLVDCLQEVEGVFIPHVMEVSSSWIDPTLSDYGVPKPIDVKTIPVSGYFEVFNFDGISYVV